MYFQILNLVLSITAATRIFVFLLERLSFWFVFRVVQESSMDGNGKEGEISIVNIGGGSVFVLYQNIGVSLVSSR